MIESNEAGISVTGPHVNLFAARACLGALSIEINTGMSMSGGRSAMDAANGWLAANERPTITGKRTKANKLATYKALRALLVDAGMTPNDQRTMGHLLGQSTSA